MISPGRIPIDAAGELLMEETKPCTIGGADPAEPTIKGRLVLINLISGNDCGSWDK
jgi:hypothetical protein